MQKFIFEFDKTHPENLGETGLKAVQLAELARLGCNISPGFVVSTEVCNHYLGSREFPPNFEKQLAERLAELEKSTGRRFGDPGRPLLLIMRPSEPTRMPDLFKSAYCVGMNRVVYDAFCEEPEGVAFANLVYKRFLKKYAEIRDGVSPEEFDAAEREFYETRRLPENAPLTKENFLLLLEKFGALVSVPENPAEQMSELLAGHYRNWKSGKARKYRVLNDIDEKIGMAVIIQQSVFGDKDEGSGVGIAFSRNPITGERRITGEYFPNSTGYEIRKGSNNLEDLKKMKLNNVEQYERIKKLLIDVERHFADLAGFEFALQGSELFVLGMFHWRKTGLASVRVAVEMHEQGQVNELEALKQLQPEDMNYFILPMIDPTFKSKPLFKGIAASPGAASGKVVFTLEQAEKLIHEGEKAILIRRDTTPEDIHGLKNCAGIITSQGGLTSHAAVVARTLGKAAVTGCNSVSINLGGNYLVTEKGARLELYDVISINGSTGQVFSGHAPMIDASFDGNFKKIMEWASTYCMTDIRANCDTPEAVRKSIEMGADGVGLCRTEHMFFEPGRIDTMRSMILAQDPDQRQLYLEILHDYMKEDLDEIFTVLNGRPCCIRLLDPPLHEFLPQMEESLANFVLRTGEDYGKVKDQVEGLKESNPMLGFRGCRLPIVHPEITVMQTRAVINAAIDAERRGVPVNPELMLPLISTAREIEFMREIIENTIEEEFRARNHRVNYKFGAMIETPRACLRCDQIAKQVDFISFGTNDLTQLAYGFSRDDIGKFLDVYIENGMLNHDPFERLDLIGIGSLIKFALGRAKEGNPGVKLAACGEQNSDPKTVEFFGNLNFDYVSCAPFRIPVAKLAAAQSTLRKFGMFKRRARPS